jgi:hypothetical protein
VFAKILPVLEEPELVQVVVSVFAFFMVTVLPGSITQEFSNDLTQLLWPYSGYFWGEVTNGMVTSILDSLPKKVKTEEESRERKKK